MAEGSHGSSASAPVTVSAEAPASAPETSIASLAAAAIAEDGTLSVVGAGFKPSEFVSLVAVTGVSSGYVTKKAVATGIATDTGVLIVEMVNVLSAGAYTLEGIGNEGSYTTAALIITAAAK